MLIRPVNLCWKSLGEVLFLFSAGMALTGLSCHVISASLIKVRGMTMRSRQFTKTLIYAGTSHSLCSPLASGSFDWPLCSHHRLYKNFGVVSVTSPVGFWSAFLKPKVGRAGLHHLGSSRTVVLNPRAACGPSRIQMRPTMLNVTVWTQLKNNFQFYNSF